LTSSLVGRTLGSYKITEQIGWGGMAAVYLGYQATVDRSVAIKVLPPHPALDANFTERFQQEARTIARLQHPHILPVFDYGTHEDILYLVMAYVEGGTLQDVMKDGAITPAQVAKVLREIGHALDYAHRQGVIHRDIKPGNILLDSEGHALLADFGIAKIGGNQADLTGSAVVGTPAYMSPEQAQGMALDGRSDIYSLGVVIFELLTGEQPFEGETLIQVMMKVIQEPPPDIYKARADLPPSLTPVMERVLAKKPEERYQTATAFATAFEDVIRNASETEAPTTPITRAEMLGKGTVTRPFTVQDTNRLANVAPSDTGQTIVLQQGTNPYVLLGGFALIAATLIIVVLLILNSQNDDATVPGEGAITIETARAANDEAVPTTDLTSVAEAAPAAKEAAEAPTFGTVSFGGSGGKSLSLQVDQLTPTPGEQVYVAWLQNTAQDTTLNIGVLALDPFGNGAISYTDPDDGILPTQYNAVSITAEDEGDTENPVGEVVYSGSIPIEMTDALRAILVSSEDGLSGGSLLDGAIVEASAATQHAGLAARSTSIGSVKTHAEHTVNILRGESEDYNGNGVGENPGRGVGLYTFLDLMEAELQAAIDTGGIQLEVNVEPMRVCLTNTRLRADELEGIERDLLAASTMDEAEPLNLAATTIADALLSGVDLNENGQVEPFEGECGLNQVPTYALLAGQITLNEGALDAE
jgi:serine/threonine protein kinase